MKTQKTNELSKKKICWTTILIYLGIIVILFLIGFLFGYPIMKGYSICNQMNITGC